MPYRDKKKYRDYMAEYMRQQRRQTQVLKQRLSKDTKSLEQLQKQFPDAYKLLFGKKPRRK